MGRVQSPMPPFSKEEGKTCCPQPAPQKLGGQQLGLAAGLKSQEALGVGADPSGLGMWVGIVGACGEDELGGGRTEDGRNE